MKKLVVLLMVTLFVGNSVFAQQRQRATPEERAKKQTETLVKELKLTKEQETKVYEINLKYAQPREDNSSATREQRREAMRKSTDERNKAIKEILTEEQQKKFDEHIKKAPPIRSQRGNR